MHSISEGKDGVNRVQLDKNTMRVCPTTPQKEEKYH